MKVEIGTILFREYEHRGFPTQIKEYTVSKIGNKYFYVKENSAWKFDIKTLKYSNKEYSQHNVQLYWTKEEILDRQERGRLLEALRKHFDYFHNNENTLDELRQVFKILGLS